MALTIKQLKRVAKEIFRHTPYTLAVWGPSGIGKDDTFRQIVEELTEETGQKWGYIDIRLANMEPGDMIGMPYRDEHNNTKYACPWWLPTDEKVARGECAPYGILALQELNRAHKIVLQGVFQLIEKEHQLNGHKLASGWRIVVTLNPPTENYSVNQFDHAFKGRLVNLIARADYNVWLEWAEKNGVDKAICGFIKTHPGMLIKEEAFDYDDLGITPNPRRYEMANAIVTKCKFDDDPQVNDALLLEVLQGLLGKETAFTLIKFRREFYERVPSGEEIVKKYMELRDRIKGFELDKYNQAADNFVEAVTAMAMDENIAKYKENILNFIQDIPYSDLKYSILRTLYLRICKMLSDQKSDKELLKVPLLRHVININDAKEIADWVRQFNKTKRTNKAQKEAAVAKED